MNTFFALAAENLVSNSSLSSSSSLAAGNSGVIAIGTLVSVLVFGVSMYCLCNSAVPGICCNFISVACEEFCTMCEKVCCCNSDYDKIPSPENKDIEKGPIPMGGSTPKGPQMITN